MPTIANGAQIYSQGMEPSSTAKLTTALMIVVHSVLSVVGALVAGFTFYTFWRPLVGHHRYNEIARSSAMVLLLLLVVALWGVGVYGRWHDRCAAFAWVLPALWCCHLLIIGGMEAFQTGRGVIATCFLMVAAVYSLGAVVGITASRKTAAEPAAPTAEHN
jgi:hypothetical protein